MLERNLRARWEEMRLCRRLSASSANCFGHRLRSSRSTFAVERGGQAFEAGLGPELSGFVVIPERRGSLRQFEPLRLPPRVDVNVWLQGAGFVERSNAHEPEIRPASVVAPDRGLTFGAAVDFVRTVLTWHRHSYRLAAQ